MRSRRWLREVIRYASRTLLPSDWLNRAGDDRLNPKILPKTLWLSVLLGFVLRVRSYDSILHRWTA